MKKIFLLVALIAVGCFVASKLLKSDDDTSDEGTESYSGTSDVESTSEANGQFEAESPATDEVGSEVSSEAN